MNRQRFLLPALMMLTVARYCMLPMVALSEFEQALLRLAQTETSWKDGLSPLLFALVKASTGVLGESAFGLRFFSPLLILAASWLLWEVVRGLFDATTASWSLLLFQVTPVVNVAAVTMTLTTTGIAATAGMLAVLRLALHRDYRFHLHWWLLAMAMVLAFLLDWRLLLLAAAVGASLVITSRGRRAAVKWPVLPVLGGCLGLALTIFLAWNSENGWPAFAPLPQVPSPSLWESTLLLPLLAFSPFLLAAHGWSLVESAIRRPLDYPVAYLYAFTWPLLALDILCWTGLAWPHAGVGAWLLPSTALLAHHSLLSSRMPPKRLLWLRAGVILLASLQTCWIMEGGPQRMLGWVW